MGILGQHEAVVVLPEHRFDYINLHDFRSRSCFGPLAYITIFLSVIVAIIGYVFDIYILLILHILNEWASAIKPIIPFDIAKWVFTGCIACSFILLVFTWIGAIRVIRGGGIASSYLNEVALSWSCIFGGVGMKGIKDRDDTGFKRFLVFKELTARRSNREYIALFSYFSFHGWIRLAFAEGPRQVINLLTLISVFKANLIPAAVKKGEEWSAIMTFFKNIGELANQDLKQALVVGAMAFSLIIWAFSIIRILIAGICYVGFLWHVMADSNGLYAYCKERIDKRMKEIVHDKMKERHKKQLAKQPTVANIGIDEKPKLSIPIPPPPPSYTSPTSTSTPQAPNSRVAGIKRTDTSSSTTGLLSQPADMGYATPTSNLSMSRMPSKASMNSQFTSSSGYPQTPLPPYDIPPNGRPFTPGNNGSQQQFGPPQRTNTGGTFNSQNQPYPGPHPGMQRANTGFDNRGPGVGPGPGIQRANTGFDGRDPNMGMDMGMGRGPGLQRANTDFGQRGPGMGMGMEMGGNGYGNQRPGMGDPRPPQQQQGFPQRPLRPDERAALDIDYFNGNTMASSAYSSDYDQRSIHNSTPGQNFGSEGYAPPPLNVGRFPVRTGTPASQLSVQTGVSGPGPIPRILTPANDGRPRRQRSQDSSYSQGSYAQPQQQQQYRSPQDRRAPSPQRDEEEFDVLAEYGGPSPEEEKPSQQFPAQQPRQQQPQRQEPQRPVINAPLSRVNTAPVSGNSHGAPPRMVPPVRSQTARPDDGWERQYAVDKRW